MEHFPEFNPSIPRHYVLKVDNVKLKMATHPAILVHGNSEKIKQDYVNATRKIEILKKTIIEHKEEIDRLSVFENSH